MKKYLLLLMGLLVATGVKAALGGDGYYRVNNVASGRYIYVEDNKGSIDFPGMTADLAAIELWNKSDRRLSDPSTVIYVKHISGRSYDFQSQGTGVYQIINYYVGVYENPTGSNRYLFYASSDGFTKYLCDSEKSLYEEQGRLADNGTGDWQRWEMTPITTSSDNYFGILPEVKVGNTHYATFFASFPFSFASGGMEAYTISKVDNGMAVLKKITGVIPASTPIFVKCAGEGPAANKLNLGGTASAISGNLLKGIYFNNASRTHPNRTSYDSNTMRVLGTLADGSIGFVTSNQPYLAKNRAYLTVPAGSPAQIKIVTEEEYNNSFVTVGVAVADAAQGSAYINTSGTTSVKVVKGSGVTLTATPKAPYVFSSWTLSGNQVSTSATTTVKAEANATYTANFTLPEYVVNVSAAHGRVEATAGSDALVSGKTYRHGTSVTISGVKADDGYEFASLSVGGKDVTADFKSKGSYTFQLTEATDIVATFTAIPVYAVTLKADNGRMTVTAAGVAITSGSTYRRGTSVSITSVVADDGYEFATLSVGGKDITTDFTSKGSYTFELTGATDIVATFTAIPVYAVTLDADNGNITVTAAGVAVTSGSTYRRGTSMSVTSVVPDDGYELAGLEVNGKDILPSYLKNEKYDFTLTEATTVAARFDRIPEYSLTVSSRYGLLRVEREDGMVVNSGATLRRDTPLVIKSIKVTDGWRIVSLKLNDVEILSAFNNSPDGYRFTITEDVRITAEYEKVTPDPEPRVYTSFEGNGRLIVSPELGEDPEAVATYDSGDKIPYSPEGTQIYVYLIPGEQMIIGEVIINGSDLAAMEGQGLVTRTPYGAVIEFTVIDQDANISARFVDDPASIDFVSSDSDDAGAEYFDLNGVRVSSDSLVPGIYLRRQGSRVTKVVIP